jgi:chemotaxis signal transduction protein
MESGALWFELSGRRFAIPLAQVREVVTSGVVTPMPGAPPCLYGLTSVRGGLIPVVDLGPLVGGAPGVARPGSALVVVEAAPQPWSDGQPARAAIAVERVLALHPLARGAKAQESDAAAATTALDVAALLGKVRAEVEASAREQPGTKGGA